MIVQKKKKKRLFLNLLILSNNRINIFRDSDSFPTPESDKTIQPYAVNSAGAT